MKKQTISAALKWGSLVAAASAAIVQTLAYLLSYDPNANYFYVGAPLPYIAAALAILGAICGILCAALMPADSNAPAPFSDNVLPSLPAALAMGAFPIVSGSLRAGTLPFLASIALFCAAVYSVLCATDLRKTNPTALCVLGFAAILACAMTTATYYFDASLEMNAPTKVAPQTALLFAMLYYTAELRYLLNRAKPRLFVALSLLTLSISALSAIPMMVAFFCGIIDRKDCLAGALLMLGISVTVLLRLIRVLRAKKTSRPLAEQIVFAPSYGSEVNDK